MTKRPARSERAKRDVSADGAPMLNRFAVILRPTQAYLDWTRPCPDPDLATKLANLREESTAYLIPDASRGPAQFVKKRFRQLFAAELAAWYLDEDYWPKDLSFEAFCRFFEVQIASCVFDLGAGPIVKE
jgi:hypothetical protein